jgi:hypothetical protein
MQAGAGAAAIKAIRPRVFLSTKENETPALQPIVPSGLYHYPAANTQAGQCASRRK